MSDTRLTAIENTLKYNAETLKSLHETIQKQNAWITHLESEVLKLKHGIPDPPKGRNANQIYHRSKPLID